MWNKNYPFTDIWSFHSSIQRNFNRCFKYVWKNQNKYEQSHNTNWITHWQMIDWIFFLHFSSLCKCDHPEILNPKRQSNIILVTLIIIWHWKVIEGKLLASLTSFVSFVIRYNFRLCPHQFSIGVGNDILYDFRWINNGWHDYWPLLTYNILKDV